MANLYKKTYPVPMPAGAEVIQRRGKPVVRWTDKRGNTKTAPLADDGKRMMYVSDVWYARYKDVMGRERRVSTGCRDEQAARKKLADIIAEQEKLRVGFITPEELDTAEQGKRPIAEHVAEYLNYLKTKRVRGRKVSAHYRRNVDGRLRRIIADCRLAKLADITTNAINRWLDEAEEADMAAATRNEYLTTMIAFCNWLVRERRLVNTALYRDLHPLVVAELEKGTLLQSVAKEMAFVVPKRQLEILKLMQEGGDWSLAFIKAQVLATQPQLRSKKRRNSPWQRAQNPKRDLVKKLAEVEKHYDFYSALYRQYVGDLLKLAIYVRQIVSRPELRDCLAERHPDDLRFFESMLAESEGKATG